MDNPASIQLPPSGANPPPVPPPAPDVLTPTQPTAVFAWLAFAIALAGSLGTVYLSVGMKLEACPLCLYQRMAVMGVASLLLVGLLSGTHRKAPLCRLAIPLAIGGMVVAGFHSYLDYQGVFECPDGLFGLGKPPYQSLVMFVLLLVALLADESVQWMREPSGGVSSITGALVFGAAIGVACIQSGPPLRRPTEPYKTELKGCRPVYVGSTPKAE